MTQSISDFTKTPSVTLTAQELLQHSPAVLLGVGTSCGNRARETRNHNGVRLSLIGSVCNCPEACVRRRPVITRFRS
jgi:hypothetical protein